MTSTSHGLVGSERSRALRRTHPDLRAVVLSGDDRAADAGRDLAAEGLGGAVGSVTDSLTRLDVPVTRACDLRELAGLTEAVAGPVLVVADDLRLSSVALLDIVDAPSSATTAVTLEPEQALRPGAEDAFTPVRVSRAKRIESAATRRHTVGRPTGYAVGLIRVADADRGPAARLWREAAAADTEAVVLPGPAGPTEPAEPAVAPVDLALLALVRGGLPVAATSLGLYTVGRGGVTVDGPPGSPWQQRLRSSSRGNDGAFSRAVVRPLSRRLTALGLAHDWRPNAVTAASLTIGLAAAALVLLDSWWAWAAAALLLQLSLVVDCVDGEIARFTRSYSPLGAWLDGVSDRIKEFAVIATVTVVGVRHGHDLWGLSVAVLAILTMRQVEDQAYHARLLASASEPDTVRSLDDPSDGSDPSGPTTVPVAGSWRGRLVTTVKQVLHVPIAERYLLISLGLLTHDATLLLVVLLAAVLVALAWTHLGRTVRALQRADGFRADQPDTSLALLFDLGPVSRWVAAVASAPAAAARSPFGWQLPGWVGAAEAAVALGVVASLDAAGRWVAFAWFGAVAWHLYDMTYRARETGRGPAGWVRAVTLGSAGRILLLGLWWAVGLPVAPLLGVGAVVLFALWAGESGYAWRSLTSASRPGATDSGRRRR